MINKWESLTQDNKVNLIIPILIGVLAVVGYFGKGWFESPSKFSKTVPASVDNSASQGGVILTNQSGKNVAITGSGTVNIGITPKQYDQGLKRREIEVRTELKQAHTKDRQRLEIELQAIQIKLQNSKTSYEEHITSLKERIAQLEKFRGQLPDKILRQAINALKRGDRQQADQLFKQIEEQADFVIKVAAEAAYQRCLIAEDDVHYLDALKHCEKAVRLVPDHSLYLNQAGKINHILANYKKVIVYLELALNSDLKTYGEGHPAVATSRNNLGLAWDSLGEYQKAIKYYELALSSDLITYGKNHPDVATGRNNLGSAWKALGEYQKAIGYLEQALSSDLKTVGEDHPDVARDRNNLGEAWRSLGEINKAIKYYEQALSSNLKNVGEDHPRVATDRNNLGLAWQSLGEYQKSIAYYEQALVTFEKKLGKDHPNTKVVRSNLANAKEELVKVEPK